MTITSLRRIHTSGFSLIELISVVAILGTLAALLMPVVNKAVKSAHSGKCLVQLKSLGAAFQLYENEHSYITPTSFQLADEKSSALWYQDASPVNEYIRDNKISSLAICPSNRSSSPRAGIPGKGYPYFSNYNVMIINSTGSVLMPKFKSDRPSTLIRLMDTTKDSPDWGPGGNDMGEVSRMGRPHSDKTSVLWLDNHVSQVKFTELTIKNFRWSSDSGM